MDCLNLNLTFNLKLQKIYETFFFLNLHTLSIEESILEAGRTDGFKDRKSSCQMLLNIQKKKSDFNRIWKCRSLVPLSNAVSIRIKGQNSYSLAMEYTWIKLYTQRIKNLNQFLGFYTQLTASHQTFNLRTREGRGQRSWSRIDGLAVACPQSVDISVLLS